MRCHTLFWLIASLPAIVCAQQHEQNPYTTPADVAEGRRLYNLNCRTCHGMNGERADLGVKLASTMRRHGSSDREMFQTISSGVPGTAMPGMYGDETAIWKVLAFVRTLERTEEHGGEPEILPQLRDFPKPPPVTPDQLLQASNRPGEWLMYSGDYASRRYSGLKQIDAANAGRLQLKWIFQRRVNTSFETTPIVAGGAMYITVPPSDVYALNAENGEMLWQYMRPMPTRIPACCGQVNRGLAIAGDRLFLATLDAHIVALDRHTGRVVWDKKIADYREGYTATHAPLVVKDKVLVGVAGGEYGIRGFLDAYRIADGQRAWRSYTIPATGEFGNDSWDGDSWKRGGAPIWLTGSYDPELNLTYWGTGNPGPDWNGEVRHGDNLFAASVLALDVDTGARKWYFQFTPHDVHDWDAVQIQMLLDHDFQGRMRKMLVTANRNGFFYLLDRATGEFLHAQPYVKQTWAKEIDQRGRPVVNREADPAPEGTRVYPAPTGGTNWWSPSYSPLTDLFYVQAVERSALYYRDDAVYKPGALYEGGTVRGDTDLKNVYGALRALDLTAGKPKWEYRMDVFSRAGVLSTAGGIVMGATGNGRLFVLNASTGQELWTLNLGGPVVAGPIAFESRGQERLAIAAGGGLFVFGLPGSPQ